MACRAGRSVRARLMSSASMRSPRPASEATSGRPADLQRGARSSSRSSSSSRAADGSHAATSGTRDQLLAEEVEVPEAQQLGTGRSELRASILAGAEGEHAEEEARLGRLEAQSRGRRLVAQRARGAASRSASAPQSPSAKARSTWASSLSYMELSLWQRSQCSPVGLRGPVGLAGPPERRPARHVQRCRACRCSSASAAPRADPRGDARHSRRWPCWARRAACVTSTWARICASPWASASRRASSRNRAPLA